MIAPLTVIPEMTLVALHLVPVPHTVLPGAKSDPEKPNIAQVIRGMIPEDIKYDTRTSASQGIVSATTGPRRNRDAVLQPAAVPGHLIDIPETDQDHLFDTLVTNQDLPFDRDVTSQDLPFGMIESNQNLRVGRIE